MIYKTIKQDKYQCINNEVFVLPISEGARCLLAYMLTKPADWKFYNKAIEGEFKINSSRLKRYLKELKDYGLVRRYRTQVTGRLEWITEVYESLDLVPTGRNSIGSKSTDTKSIDTQKADILSTDPNKVLTIISTDYNTLPKGKGLKAEYGRSDINELFKTWADKTGIQISSKKQANRNACSNLLKKYSQVEIAKLIDGVALAQADRYAPRICDFIQLQSKLTELLTWGKKHQLDNQMEVY